MNEPQPEPAATDTQKLLEIMRLLDRAYDRYFKETDGHCKSDEGYVAVNYGNYFTRNGETPALNIAGVQVYSYVFGPNRMHHFDSIDEALQAVREWTTAWGEPMPASRVEEAK